MNIKELPIGQRVLEFSAHDLHKLISWITDGAVPSPSDSCELKRVLISENMQGMIGLEIEANWKDFTWDASGKVPFAIDVRYNRGESESVVLFDEKGVPVRRTSGPTPRR